MIPSNSPYSSGWSSTWTASRLSARLGEGPFGTAQDLSTPSISRRRSQWSRRAACIWTTKSPPADAPGVAGRAPGSGVRSRDRLARYVPSGSGPGFRFAGIGVKSYHSTSMSAPIDFMSAHPLGSATLSFGLVSVPIKMFSTGESSAAISFNWLHKKDGARLKQQYVCSKDGENVEKEDMIKGYEFSKGRYVQFTPDELKALEEKGTGSINITEFVDADTVDRMYMDKVYFMGPDKGGDRAFTLLGEALKKTRKVAIGQWAARGKQYLVMIRPLGRGLAMEQLRYANEVRSIDEVPIPKVDVKKAELDMAVQLVEQAASETFGPRKYGGTVKARTQDQHQRAVGAALRVSGPGAAARREGADGGPDPGCEDPRLAAPAEAAAATGTGALGAAHHGRGTSGGGAGRCPRLESGFGAAGARLRRGDSRRARGPAGTPPGGRRPARGGRSRRRAVVRPRAGAGSERPGGRPRRVPAG